MRTWEKSGEKEVRSEYNMQKISVKEEGKHSWNYWAIGRKKPAGGMWRGNAGVSGTKGINKNKVQ